ncbi:MAG TPA: Gfo/Idh/MocA family oxidoreductase [Chloroflexota bacterium]|jgi:predicted dehydrogenase|nr:Gfo/Idh/MocA family oxidoreductase [Chloroflexota bacterium]
MAVPTLRVAIVGAGMIGRAHARAFRALEASFQPPPVRIELTVVADADGPLAEDARSRWEFERTATHWQAVAEAKDVDVAVVALPNFQHGEAVNELLQRGKNVLCEKPLASTLDDSLAMLRSAERAGVVHGVGFNLRRLPAIAAIHQLIDDGTLGEIRQYSARYLTDYAASMQTPFTWRYQRKLAGSGALGDIASHVIDLGRFLVSDIARVDGAALATRITERFVPTGHVTGHAQAATTGEKRTVDTDDLGSFTATFDSGAVGAVRFSRIATGYRNSAAFEIVGEHGSVEFDTERAAEFQLYVEGDDASVNGSRRVVVGPEHPYFSQVTSFPVAGVGYGYSETYLAQAYEFVRAIAEQRPYSPGFGDGLAVVEVCEAVLQSAEQGVAITLGGVAVG